MKTRFILAAMRSTLLVSTIWLSPGCTKNLKPEAHQRHVNFGIKNISPGWVQRTFPGAEIFLEHETRPASIFFSAHCEKVSDSPLEALTAQLLVGFSDIKIGQQESVKIADRQALVSEIRAKLDGVERFLKIMVLRKDYCVLDAVFSSSPEQAELAQDFSTMILSFWAEVGS